jgi:proteasome accessory factor BC
MAKDTEKLIRQLSLISYLMAERRPVTALEIRRDVEGYSEMNEDAFARRFYADRAELESLGIELQVDKPADSLYEQENYSLPPENFHLPAVEFTDEELAALHTALALLDGEFAYAEPLRLALQQISWGRPNPLTTPAQRSVALGITGSAGGRDISQRLAKVDTAIYRRKTIEFEYFTMERGDTSQRKVDPYTLLFQGGQFHLVGWSHERQAVRQFRLSRITGKVAYATKAEHDFQRPEDFDPRAFAHRTQWQLGDTVGTAEVWVDERVAWHVERNFGEYGELRAAPDGGLVYATEYGSPRLLISWVLGLAERAQLIGPSELVDELRDRVGLLVERHEGELELAPVRAGAAAEAAEAGERDRDSRSSRDEAAIRPERFARLVTLASVLIEAGRAGRRLAVKDVLERLNMSDQELREDLNVLNVVNFGGGSYVLYAEIVGDEIDVDPEPYSDNFARPARLLPVEAKALIAAIDLIGEHIPEGSLASAREKIVAALGDDPVHEGLQVAAPLGEDREVVATVSNAIARRRLLELDYYKANEDELTRRTVEPLGLINGREGWYVVCFDPAADGVRHFRLDRIKQAEISEQEFDARPELDPLAGIEGWPRTGEVPASRAARVWIAPERARWAREERRVVEELEDGSVVVELTYKGLDWLVREVLKEAGDATVLEPADARQAVLAAARRLSPAGAAR